MNFQITLPEWAISEHQHLPDRIVELEDRMRMVIRFARMNFERKTGGPFAAGVFEKHSGRVLVIGVNRVIPSNISAAHAEMVALSLAQKQLGSFDLGAPRFPDHQLVVNGWPCAMCFGALPWSGIRSLVVAATGNQIEQITGFDEGPRHPHWEFELEKRGIEVIKDVLAESACQVFRDFAASDGLVYNARSGSSHSNEFPHHGDAR